ncbi:hypothetical protein FJZ19_01385 [Candidatus Pacearchaeota archaeon]|nr:hypothetical protein [Candidatus Pacearchaeota archaeon]
MEDLRECDYVVDKNYRIYIVRGYKNKNKILANLVFEPSSKGRYNILFKKNYQKVIDNNIMPCFLKRKNIKFIFKPNKEFSKIYNKIKESKWEEIADFIMRLGVKKDDIGIFGSALLGFDIEKDVDFVVYGIKNYNKIKNNIKKLKNKLVIGNINKNHISYQIKKHGSKFSKKNSFSLMLRNKWASMQINKKILSTIRFVYDKNEVPEDIQIKKGKKIIISGKTFGCWRTNFSPRIFKIITSKREYRVLTYFWIYQSCVRDGQKVRIKGELNKKNNTIYLSKFQHWIKILK